MTSAFLDEHSPGRKTDCGKPLALLKNLMKKCPRPDLNWHRDLIPQRILSPVRLPISPLGHECYFNHSLDLQTAAMPIAQAVLASVSF